MSQEPVSAPPPPSSVQAARRAQSWRVLIVDDDEPSRRTTAAQLSPSGYEVLFAANGTEALDIVQASSPDLLLLDVMMPGMNGIEVCRRLREPSREDYIPVILLTALDGRREVVMGLEAGADDFLSKPVHGAELRARVANLLKVRSYHQLVTTQRNSARATVDELRQQILHADRLATLGTFAAGVSALVVSVFYLIPQMVGAGSLIKPLLGFPHWAGVLIVGVVVTTIVTTAGMVSTTYVQFIKGSLLVVFCLILIYSIAPKYGFKSVTG